jgi:hypothetical protein
VSPMPREAKDHIPLVRQTGVTGRAPVTDAKVGPANTLPAESTRPGRAVISKWRGISIRHLVVGIGVGFIDGILIGNIVTVFSTSAGGALAFLFAWVLMSYIIYRYPQTRIAIGSIVLCLGIISLLIPLGFFVIGSQMGGFGALAGGLGAIAFALILGPLSIVLALIGFWLVTQGLRRLREKALRRSQQGPWLEHSVPSVVLESALKEVSALSAEQNSRKSDRSQLFTLCGVPPT